RFPSYFLSTHTFLSSLDEDQNVKLYWNVSETRKEILFTVEANTLGWVGFGISSGQGKMEGADIVIGWVKDGKPYFQVLNDFSMPIFHHGQALKLYECRDDVPEHHLNYTGRCYSSNMPPPLRQCSGSSTIFAWAVGGKEFYFPKHVGFPIGTPDSPKVVILEVHYDNPQEREGMIDSSGLRLYYTKRLRKYDAGMLYVGAAVDQSMMIPPKEKSWEFNGFCSEECTKEGLRNSKLPEGGINVIASGLHTHLAGRKVILRHIRNGLELPEIARDEHYDFNFQEYHLLDKEIHIASGDSLITKCIYDTQDRNWVTNGGISTREEMCLSFLVYYPKVNFSRCVSWEKPAWQKWNDEYVKQNYSLLLKPSFWNKEVNQGLREAYRDTNEIYARCLARAHIALPGLGYKETQKPLIKTPYKPKPSCDIVSMATRGVVPGSLGVLIAVVSLITFVH
ncbi:DBH-like monooxygenase protein 1, partial [Montipora capricornis]|uniref:DBH-like monooxygenase protein 1 n=1 Tax=Montipora capricornis TaxID=246305 RepID=UPI0035F1553D